MFFVGHISNFKVENGLQQPNFKFLRIGVDWIWWSPSAITLGVINFDSWKPAGVEYVLQCTGFWERNYNCDILKSTNFKSSIDEAV